MNYWVIVNLLFLLCNSDYVVGQQSTKIGFVTILPTNEWKLLPGEKMNVAITFKIREGYHIQANKVLEDHLIPTSLSLQETEEIIIGKPIFPPPHPFHLKDVSQEMLVFHKELKVSIPVFIRESAIQGEYTINGNMHYQVCDSLKCYFPRDFSFNINIVVAKVKN